MSEFTDTTVKFAAWLTKARAKSKMSYEKLARESGLSVGGLNAIERGLCSPSLDTMHAICNVFKTTPAKVFDTFRRR